MPKKKILPRPPPREANPPPRPTWPIGSCDSKDGTVLTFVAAAAMKDPPVNEEP